MIMAILPKGLFSAGTQRAGPTGVDQLEKAVLD